MSCLSEAHFFKFFPPCSQLSKPCSPLLFLKEREIHRYKFTEVHSRELMSLVDFTPHRWGVTYWSVGAPCRRQYQGKSLPSTDDGFLIALPYSSWSNPSQRPCAIRVELHTVDGIECLNTHILRWGFLTLSTANPPTMVACQTVNKLNWDDHLWVAQLNSQRWQLFCLGG